MDRRRREQTSLREEIEKLRALVHELRLESSPADEQDASDEHWHAFLDAHPELEELGRMGDG